MAADISFGRLLALLIRCGGRLGLRKLSAELSCTASSTTFVPAGSFTGPAHW